MTTKTRIKNRKALVQFVIAILAFPLSLSATEPAWIVHGRQCMVSSDHLEASKAGLEILSEGGNAVDAACAVSFALAVTRPQSTGLGGGGFLIARFAYSGTTVALDFRETAPSASSPGMFDQALTKEPNKAPPSVCGYLAAAVPGLPAGRAVSLQKWGTISMAEVLAPAIRLAEEGFPVDEHYIGCARAVAKKYDRYPELKSSCDYVWKTHLCEGRERKPGEILRQPALGALLRYLANHGVEGFYTGPIAQDIVSEIQNRGGLMTLEDLAGYKPVQRTPLTASYRGYDCITMPPPSSGGVCLIQALNILETVDMPHLAKKNRPLAHHYFTEAMKHAFADRARWMADPDFVPVPTELLTCKPYAKQLAPSLDPNQTGEPDTYGSELIPGSELPDDSGTSHFCVIDRWGNCVVSTETVNTSFGSLAAVGKWGLILNNEMDDFTAHSGKANVFGLVQSDRNAPEPGKRPLSSMTPTIFLRDGKPYLLIGGSGGPRIISSVLNVAVDVLDYKMTLEDALAAPRIHHQWSPDEVYFDRDVPTTMSEGLRERGHVVSNKHRTGIVQAILSTSGEVIGGSDPRKGGCPVGY